MNVRDKFIATRKELSGALIERENEIDLSLTAMLCKEHFLMVGMPGVAKSMLCDSLLDWFDGPTYSDLFTKFMEPKQVFGSVVIRKLTDGNETVTRIAGCDTRGMLPSSVLAFTDELFNGSSAILNTTLKILNERIFVNDGVRERCPLWTAFAGSNHWPNQQEGGQELGALFDRFLIRTAVRPIASESGRRRLLWGGPHNVSLSTRLTPTDLAIAHTEAQALPMSKAATDAFTEILSACRADDNQIYPSDRRMYKSVASTKAYAYLNGATRVEPEHLEVLAAVLWSDPIEHPTKLAKLIGKIANPVGMAITGMQVEVDQLVGSCNGDLKARLEVHTKLKEVHKKLDGMKHPRALGLKSQVEAEMKQIALAAMDLS